MTDDAEKTVDEVTTTVTHTEEEETEDTPQEIPLTGEVKVGE